MTTDTVSLDHFIELLKGASLSSESFDEHEDGQGKDEHDDIWMSGHVEAYLEANGLTIKFQTMASFPARQPSRARVVDDKPGTGNAPVFVTCNFEVEDEDGDVLDEDDIVALAKEHTEFFDTDWYDLSGFGDDEIDCLSGRPSNPDFTLRPSAGTIVTFKGERMFSARGEGFDSIETELSLYEVELDDGAEEDIWVLFARNCYGRRKVFKFKGESAGSDLALQLDLLTSEHGVGFRVCDSLVEIFKYRSLSHLDRMPEDWEEVMSGGDYDEDEEEEDEDGDEE